jgi:YgiT-type zinc finger domain-containing protein
MPLMIPRCSVCGGEVIEKGVEKIVGGGNDVALLKPRVGVCTKCGGRLYDADACYQIDTMRRNLLEGRHGNLKRVGTVYGA